MLHLFQFRYTKHYRFVYLLTTFCLLMTAADAQPLLSALQLMQGAKLLIVTKNTANPHGYMLRNCACSRIQQRAVRNIRPIKQFMCIGAGRTTRFCLCCFKAGYIECFLLLIISKFRGLPVVITI
jgi:hypothetical protein